MAKLWSSLSVLLVVVMLLFLAPTLLLLPGQIVSATDGAAVTQEVAGSLSFNETTNGDWWDFTAGGPGGVNATYGLYLAQYTRADVTRATNLTGCGFRNYTTASGSLSGDLSGSLSLSLIAFNFNLKYPNTTLYHDYSTGAHFGWMTGRGHFYATNTSNNFTFVYVLDFDSDSATMSNAVGKGFLMSVAENGTFGNATSSNVTDMHKIIGDFTITKSGANYTGTYNLRIYPPNEVYDLDLLNVTGGVVQETTDPIRSELDILNFGADGPQVTPNNWTTDFEEVGWGKDSPKVVTSGHLGINGDMVVARNTALYLELGAGWNPPGVRIMGTTVNNIYIDDTNTSVRAGDGTPYGKLWELLVLFIPNQKLDLGQNFTQQGYTYTPFGLLNNTHNPTECYAGTESFALATILISSSLSDAKQWSVDHSYGLYPTPKVTSVNPASASPNMTLNVTITGRYFLRANGTVPSSGSVSFGPNITVNSYTIGNASPIANTITANITIGAGAAGPSNVSVTSCFNYTNGSGIAPYETGTLVNGFTVVTGNATLEGHVSYLSRGTNNARWSQPFKVRAFQAGNLNNEIWKTNATTNNTGVFIITGLSPETYDIGIKNFTCLSELNTSVTLINGSTTVVDFGTTREGDSNGNDAVTGMDFSILSGVFNTAPAGNPNCDFNRDNAVTGMDFSLLNGQFNKAGPLQGH